MKIWKKLLSTLLAVAFMVCLSNSSVLAAEEYTYTITFRAGVRGSFASTEGLSVTGDTATVSQTDDKIVVSGLNAGDVVSFNAQAAVDLDEESKHYVQGVRLSGRDNDTVSESVFTVDSDEDYVVAYGIQGNMTSFTIIYQDAAGNTLAPTDTFYGNVGDKPIVAYKYIEGYQPKVLGYTKTLSENAAENVFTFVYDKIVVQDIIQNVPGPATPGNGFPQGPTDPGRVEPEDTTPETDVQDDVQENEPDLDQNQIVDLDDEETPLGNVDVEEKPGVPLIGMIAMIIIALVALANIIFFVKRKNR